MIGTSSFLRPVKHRLQYYVFLVYYCVIHLFTPTPDSSTAPSGTPLNLTGTPLGSTSVSLSWSSPPIDLQNGIIRHYEVNLTEMETGTVLTYTTVNTNISVSALHPAYTYLCSVAAVTVAVGPETDPIVITTLEDGRFHQYPH